MDKALSGKTALVVGGSSGIGKAVVERLEGHGKGVGSLSLTREHRKDSRQRLPTPLSLPFGLLL